MISNPILKKFLALDHVRRLKAAIEDQQAPLPAPPLSWRVVTIAVAITLLPTFSPFFGNSLTTADITTILIGTAALLAMIIRVRSKIQFRSVTDWKRALRLTHTAFGLGCIPTVLVLIVHSDSLYALQRQTPTGAADGGATVAIPGVLGFILGVAIWAALTEEIIYRGLLISVLRRWRAFKNQWARDVFAILVSAAFFSLGHLPTWGPTMSLALLGTGIGLGVAYIAIGELLLPVIVYHALFNFASLTVAFITHRF